MDEEGRLKAVEGLELAKIASLDAFEVIAILCARMLQCSVAAIIVVGRDHNRILAQTGLELSGTLRAGSFCSACIAQGEPLIIADAAADPLFNAHPFVTESLSIRSYIGIPLRIGEGFHLGTLCAMSPEPDAFSQADIRTLEQFSLLAEKGLFAHANGMELVRAISSLRELNQLFKQAEVAAQIGSWRVEFDTGELRWSRQVYAIHGISPETHMDKANALQFYVPQDREAVQKAMIEAAESGQPFRYEAGIQRPDGQIRRVRAMGERIDIAGRPTSIAGVFLDCTDDFLKAAALQRAAERDRLTGLYNRAAFDSRLAAKLEANDHALITLLLMDLDGFKEVNDTLGHLVGDRLLSKLAERLRQEAGDEVFVARWGGDEFAFLFKPNADLSDAYCLGKRLMELVRDEVLVGDEAIVIGATSGIAQMRRPASNEELVRRADAALYAGKTERRGSIKVWSKEIDGVQASRQKALLQVRAALNAGRAFAAYQPIVELATGKVLGLEALLRVVDEQGQILTAGNVLPALLDPQISRRVSRFMLERVLDDGPTLLRQFGPGCNIGINVSEADLRTVPGEEVFVEYLMRRVADSSLRPANLTLEVTETMLLLDSSGHIQDSLRQIDEAGFTVALDDFGTGFSSLTHLRDFPIRKIKVDRGFVQAITSEHQSRLIIQAIIQLGKSLGVAIVAEGVETEAQEIFLRASGCGLVQGYRYGMPQRVEDWQQEPAPRALRS